MDLAPIVGILVCLFGLASPTTKIPKIAVIGGGIGGASSSHFLRELFGVEQVDIHLYEPKNVGGRLATVEIGSRQYESGGSIIHPQNFYMANLTALLGLKPKDPTPGLFGIYNGTEYVFKENSWSFITVAHLAWQYGWSALKLQPWVAAMLKSFSKIYKLQQQGHAFTTVAQLLAAMDLTFPSLTQKTSFQYLISEGFSKKFLDDLGLAASLTNYGQNLGINAFAGAVSLAGADSGVWCIRNGNKQIPEKLLKRDIDTLHQAKVVEVALMPSGNFNVTAQSQDKVFTEVYDIVIIAVPLIKGVSDIKLRHFPKEIGNFPGRYHRTVATFVQGCINRSALALQNGISEILVNNENLPYNSIGKAYPVDYVHGDMVPEVWKVFSQKPLAPEVLDSLFVANREVKTVDWLAYPQFDSTRELQPFVLYPGLFYTSAIEWAASAMEISVISGKNSALLAYYHWLGKSNLIDTNEKTEKNEL